MKKSQITVVHFLIILVALIGLFNIKNCNLRHAGLIDGEVTRLMFKKSKIFPYINSIAFETGRFLRSRSKGSLRTSIKDVFSL